MSVLTIGAFMHDLNIGNLDKQANALEAFKEQIDLLFTSKLIPNLDFLKNEYGREKFISKVVADSLDYYYQQFKNYIQHEYSVNFDKLIREEQWSELETDSINQKSDKGIVKEYIKAIEY